MKSVLISIQPKWCELIASGKKTVEVRKTRPNLETPFKCYIYQTKGHTNIGGCGFSILGRYRLGKVIAEFVCDWVESTSPWRLKGNTGFCAKRTEREEMFPKMACLSIEEIEKYAGKETRLVHGWHISNLVIYDKPRELSEFFSEGDCTSENCKKCRYFDRGNGFNVENDCLLPYEYMGTGKTLKPLFRPPQSWCYVERSVKDE